MYWGSEGKSMSISSYALWWLSSCLAVLNDQLFIGASDDWPVSSGRPPIGEYRQEAELLLLKSARPKFSSHYTTSSPPNTAALAIPRPPMAKRPQVRPAASASVATACIAGENTCWLKPFSSSESPENKSRTLELLRLEVEAFLFTGETPARERLWERARP